MLAVLVVMLIVTAGCLNVLGDSETKPHQESPEQPTSVSPTGTVTETETTTTTTTSTPVAESTKEALRVFEQNGEPFFRENTNLTSIDIYREDGTADLVVTFGLPDTGADKREDEFEAALEILVGSHRNFVKDTDGYQPTSIRVETDYGTGSASRELLDLHADGKLEELTVAYIWAGEFEPYTTLRGISNSSHPTRKDRLEHTARRIEKRLSNGTYVKNPEAAIQDETLYLKILATEEAPNPAFPQNETAYAYYQTVTKHGVDYMPYDGMRVYQYRANGTAEVTWNMQNHWVVSEYVGIRPYGELALNSLNTFEGMDEPHEGPP